VNSTLLGLVVVVLFVGCGTDPAASSDASAGAAGQAEGGASAGSGGKPSSAGTSAAAGDKSAAGDASNTGGVASTAGASSTGENAGGETETSTGGAPAASGSVSPVEGYQYMGQETTNCEAGHAAYWEATAAQEIPDPSCVRPTGGTNIATRWCCAAAFCSRSSVTQQVCAAVYKATPYGYSCDPKVTELSTCMKQANNAACCPFAK
jgi:hypothetical protein